MRILTRYILGEVLSHTLVGIGLFTFVLFMPQLVQILELVVQDGASPAERFEVGLVHAAEFFDGYDPDGGAGRSSAGAEPVGGGQ